MSIVPLLNLFGSTLGYPAAEYFGRKPTLMATNVMQIIGFSIIYFSNNFALLMVGRSLTCFALGFGVMVPFVLISEITTIKQRAPLSVINTQSISYGILPPSSSSTFAPPSISSSSLLGSLHCS